MTFSRQIWTGLAAGIATGIFFGELVAPLEIVADGFVRLLQMTVLPYVTLSIVSRLGALSMSEARALGIRGGLVLVMIWCIAFAFTCIMPLVYPRSETASFFSTTLIDRPAPFGFVDLYIPENPFHALANSIIPAVVLFSVLVGVALIGVERKETLLDVLQVTSAAVARVTRAVVRLTPYGLFAIAAVAAGTLTIDQFARLQIYLIAYVVVVLILALWVLPGLVAALTGISIRELFRRTHQSLIVAFAAADLFIVLPSLIEACKDLLDQRTKATAEASKLPDVIVPVAFNFPHAGKLLSLSFIPFAAWFVDSSFSVADYVRLAGAGVLSFFGSVNAAVPFLLDLFRLPADTFQLFLATGVINSRFGTLLAAMHTVTLAILGSLALSRGLDWKSRRLARYGAVTAALVLVVFGGLRVLFANVIDQDFAGADLVYGMRSRFAAPPATLQTTAPIASPSLSASSQDRVGALAAVRERGTLRIGVLADRLPFAFENRERHLVGLDVELAHMLAADLGVGVEFFLTDNDALADLLSRGALDIGMSGILVTPERAVTLRYSASYLNETLAFVTPDHLRERFTTWEDVRALGAVRVAIPDVPFYREALARRAPELEIVTIDNIDALFRDDGTMAYVLPAERGSVMTLLNPAYSVVVPAGDVIALPLAYALPRDDDGWAAYVDTWLALKRSDGTMDALYAHWILGENTDAPQPRWSVVRNVLHWVD